VDKIFKNSEDYVCVGNEDDGEYIHQDCLEEVGWACCRDCGCAIRDLSVKDKGYHPEKAFCELCGEAKRKTS